MRSGGATFFQSDRCATPIRARACSQALAWEAARPVVSAGPSAYQRHLTMNSALLSRRLDLAYRETEARLPANASVKIVRLEQGADLSLEPLDKIDEPTSLIALRTAVDGVTAPARFARTHTGGSCSNGICSSLHARQRRRLASRGHRHHNLRSACRRGDQYRLRPARPIRRGSHCADRG